MIRFGERHVRALVFDKDGTLFDFQRSWARWTAMMLRTLATDAPDREAQLARAIGFDPQATRFLPGSAFIAGTLDETCALMLPHLPEWEPTELHAWAVSQAAQAEMVPAVALAPMLERMRALGLRLGVATNDAESAARAHLATARIDGLFDIILGADSGFVPKPAPDMLNGFAELAGIHPSEAIMVGDSTHDLFAARAAGMGAVAVLTGVAGADELAPHADLVLADVGALADLLDASGPR